MFDRLVQVSKFLLKIFRLFAGWLRGVFHLQPIQATATNQTRQTGAEKVMALPGHVGWVPRTAGEFNHGEDHILLELQKRATHALWARLGQSWVPREYLLLLKKNPDPVMAMRVFALDFSLNDDALSWGNSNELEKLDQCTDILVELGVLCNYNLSSISYRQIVNQMRIDDYAKAETLLGVVRTFEAFKQGIKCGLSSPLATFRVFAKDVYSKEPLSLDETDIKESKEAADKLRDYEIKFVRLFRSCQEQIDWMEKNWPQGVVNQQFLNDKAKAIWLANKLGHEEVVDYVDKIDVGYVELYKNLRKIAVQEIGQQGPEEMPEVQTEDPAEKQRREERADPEKRRQALSNLGFTAQCAPTNDEIKKRWRTLCKQSHPDKATTEKEREEFTRKLQDISGAWKILEE